MSYEFQLQDIVASNELVQPGSFTHFGDPQATAPAALAYCEDLENLRSAMQNPNVSAIMARRSDFDLIGGLAGGGIAFVDHPRVVYWQAFLSLAERGLLVPEMEFGRGSRCRIHPSASVSGKTWIGDDVTIDAQASVSDYSVVGPGSIIGPGVRIGADGLQSLSIDGRKIFISHAGGVRLGERVVVLANAVISRAVHPIFTLVGDDTHLSLLSSIGHQSEIGPRCSIAGNCLIGGSVRMGSNVVIGPSVTIKDGLRIGDNARIRIGSVVIEDVPDRADISGNFAVNHVTNLRIYTRTRHGAR
ncbi:hypothetical protein ASC80_02600 [Afipia sp. Root123D2]|uniref:hypothetical protein n=1 Tax=Afipia sp. Root123D2 TaxID=1736436 RepID=UPI0006F2E061|nr:hypothetical protein [Afipia sp. Root123D2]KQW22302.1 hypothetical protein ASC80_02600 [Afipia sp. Root123D2]